MAAELTKDVLQDDIAVALAQVIAAANKRAIASGVIVSESIITITQITGGELIWRINYGPKDYTSRRGGDFIIDVRGRDASVQRVLRGQ